MIRNEEQAAKIITKNLFQSNGMVHVIDKVVMPEASVAKQDMMMTGSDWQRNDHRITKQKLESTQSQNISLAVGNPGRFLVLGAGHFIEI